jgi:hypothetical protein
MIRTFFDSLRAPKAVQLNLTILIRLLVLLSVVLALLAGYYHSSLETQVKKYQRLEDMYVRVRSQLGREETQRLIDLSRQQDSLGIEE